MLRTASSTKSGLAQNVLRAEPEKPCPTASAATFPWFVTLQPHLLRYTQVFHTLGLSTCCSLILEACLPIMPNLVLLRVSAQMQLCQSRLTRAQGTSLPSSPVIFSHITLSSFLRHSPHCANLDVFEWFISCLSFSPYYTPCTIFPSLCKS